MNTVDFDNPTPENITKWLRKNNNNMARAFIKKMIEWLIDTGMVNKDEALELKLYKIPKIRGRQEKKPIRIINREQVDQLADSTGDKKLRLMVLLSFYLGLRSNELLSLRFKDLDWDGYVCRISEKVAKGKKGRVIPICDVLASELISFIDELPEDMLYKALKENWKIFHLSYVSWNKKLEKLSKKVLGYKIKPHELRHSCGSYLQEKGLDLKEIAEFLGHSDISTTQIYLHLDKKKFKDKVMNAFD